MAELEIDVVTGAADRLAKELHDFAGHRAAEGGGGSAAAGMPATSLAARHPDLRLW